MQAHKLIINAVNDGIEVVPVYLGALRGCIINERIGKINGKDNTEDKVKRKHRNYDGKKNTMEFKKLNRSE
jgi:hypothetical protein